MDLSEISSGTCRGSNSGFCSMQEILEELSLQIQYLCSGDMQTLINCSAQNMQIIKSEYVWM